MLFMFLYRSSTPSDSDSDEKDDNAPIEFITEFAEASDLEKEGHGDMFQEIESTPIVISQPKKIPTPAPQVTKPKKLTPSERLKLKARQALEAQTNK